MQCVDCLPRRSTKDDYITQTGVVLRQSPQAPPSMFWLASLDLCKKYNSVSWKRPEAKLNVPVRSITRYRL
jgi:hypothetical protein